MVQTGPRRFEVHEFARPEVGPDDALLELELCGICGSDVEQYDGRFDAMGWTTGPTIPGHEPLGVIAEIGERAAARWGVRAGDRVAVEPLFPCGDCEACRAGHPTRCDGWGRVYSYGLLGTDIQPSLLGGYAEHMYLHPQTVLHRMSPALPASVAVRFNPLAAGVRWAVTEPALHAGDTLVVLGAGQRGLSCVIAARAARAGTVIVTDLARSSDKLDFALELGADADVTPVATQPLLDAVAIARPGGTVIVAGVKGGPTTPFDTDVILRKSITLKGVFTVDAPAYVEAIRLLERGEGPYARMHTASYPLERAEEAIHHLAGRGDRRPAINVAIAP